MRKEIRTKRNRNIDCAKCFCWAQVEAACLPYGDKIDSSNVNIVFILLPMVLQGSLILLRHCHDVLIARNRMLGHVSCGLPVIIATKSCVF